MTNIDNVIIMLFFSSLPAFKRVLVAIGYFIAMLIVLALIYVVGLITAKVLSEAYIRDLGILPIILGVYYITKLIHKIKSKGPETPDKPMSNVQQLMFNVTTQLACSVDIIAVFVPQLLKHKGDLADMVFTATFTLTVATITVIIIIFGRFLKMHWMEFFGNYIMSIVLILIGLYILYL